MIILQAMAGVVAIFAALYLVFVIITAINFIAVDKKYGLDLTFLEAVKEAHRAMRKGLLR